MGQGVTDRPEQDARGRGGRLVRRCPVCASTEHDLLYQQRFEDFAAGSITDAYDVVACRRCGMCFASGLPDEARFSEYYDQSSKYDLSAEGAELSAFDAQRFGLEARFVADHVPDRAASILDVGTATGGFLVALRDLGFANVHGVEPSEDAARIARERYGLDVVTGDATAARPPEGGFDVVSLIAVVEHLVDPVNVLRQAAHLLSPRGFLFLVAPDAARFRDHVDAPYQQFSVEHINYFTPASLGNAVAAAGLEVSVEHAGLVEASDDADGPAIEVLCRRADQPPAIRVDTGGVDQLRDYVARSAEKETGVVATIEALADGQSPIYVWGTGTNALHLLASSRLAECNIVAFLDSNPHYAGRELAGRAVMVPTAVGHLDAPILVASAISQTAIATAARNLFGPDVPLILMY
jgi:2-polyprenyl-3-methyl-5-hydroxy-6-metoxy-1,4-benzoquinol methylase